MTPDEYCRRKAAPSGSSTHYALLFLPAARRNAITALHAFCREVEDVIDECSDAQIAQTKLVWWRLELAKLTDGGTSHPVTNALRPAVENLGLKVEELAEFIEGKEIDINQSRFLDFAALAHYCGHVGGAPERAAARVLGYGDPRTLEYAMNLGIALRLTRIICGVGEDARRNRIYLPMDDLKKFGVPAADVLKAHYSEGFVELMKHQSARAFEFYGKAIDALPSADRLSQRAGLIMAAISRATLAEVERDGFRVLTHRTTLTPLRKLWLAWKTWAFA